MRLTLIQKGGAAELPLAALRLTTFCISVSRILPRLYAGIRSFCPG